MGYRQIQEFAAHSSSNRSYIVLFVIGLLTGFAFTSFRLNVTEDISYATPTTTGSSEVAMSNGLIAESGENSTLADQLTKDVRITCFVITPDHLVNSQRKYVRAWGSRCNNVLYITKVKDRSLKDTVFISGEDNHWIQTKNVFRYLYYHHRQNTDFYVKADHKSFIIPENVRYMVYPYASDLPVYFGSEFRSNKTGEPAADEYVMSRAALEMIVEQGLLGSNVCGGKDSETALTEVRKCMAQLSITQGKSQDSKGLERFLTFEPFDKPLPLNGPIGLNTDLWFRKHLFTETLTHDKSCSDTPVSFHSLEQDQLVALNCLINTIQPYGIVDQFPELPPKLTDADFEELPKFGKA